jgi:uncharacterized protein YjdB
MKLSLSLIGTSFIVILANVGCSGSGANNVVDNGKAVSAVDISPDKTTLTKGVSLQFTALVQYADGTSKEVTSDADTVWNTSNANIATVSRTGMVTTQGDGIVDITADYKGATGNEHFAVTP